MTLLLWILAYLAVGFGVAVVMQKCDPADPLPEGVAWFAVLAWPMAGMFYAFRLVRLAPLIDYCARRLP